MVSAWLPPSSCSFRSLPPTLSQTLHTGSLEPRSAASPRRHAPHPGGSRWCQCSWLVPPPAPWPKPSSSTAVERCGARRIDVPWAPSAQWRCQLPFPPKPARNDGPDGPRGHSATPARWLDGPEGRRPAWQAQEGLWTSSDLVGQIGTTSRSELLELTLSEWQNVCCGADAWLPATTDGVGGW